jgi:hypothetical protein
MIVRGSGQRFVTPPLAHARWTALTALPAAWEKAMVARRDAALRALADEAVAAAHVMRIEGGGAPRGEILVLRKNSIPGIRTESGHKSHGMM